MLLKNRDIDVLRFSLDDMYMEVLNNDLLPLELKDYVQTTDFSTVEKMKASIHYFDVFRDFLIGRMLNLSKENAKAILSSINLPQSNRTSERLQIVLACDALTMTDNFWIADDNDNRVFSDVCLRNNSLKDAAYKISILGIVASVTKEVLEPDVVTDGMFPKTWYRGDSIELWKTDKTNGNINTKMEKKVSDLLDYTNVPHVHYDEFQKDGQTLVKCNCLANDEHSVINAFALNDWCRHTGHNLVEYLEENFMEDFAKMCVIDYVNANTDRHLGNIHFFVENTTNKVIGMTPLFDHNQALVADEFGTDISSLIYDVTGLTMLETAVKYFKDAALQIDVEKFPIACQQRYSRILGELDKMKIF